jgi:hypothetical protein
LLYLRWWIGFRVLPAVYGGPAANPVFLAVRSKVDQVPVFSMSCVVDVVAEFEILDHLESLKQTLDRSAGNETKADVLGVGVLACVI